MRGRWYIQAREMDTGNTRRVGAPMPKRWARRYAKYYNRCSVWALNECPAARGWAESDEFFTYHKEQSD